MAFTINRSMITKRTIDLLVEFLRKNARTSRLYTHTQVSDRFDLEQVRIPAVIVKNVSNTQRRTDFGDFIEDVVGRVRLIPISGDSLLVGNNIQRSNLPDTLDYDPRYSFDPTIGYPSGVDINEIVYTSGTDQNAYDSGTSTGIVINIPPPTTYDPSSFVLGIDCPRLDGTSNPINPAAGTGVHTVAVALSADQEQFFLVYSGDSISGTAIQPVEPDQFIVNASGLVPGLSGTVLQLSDVLWAGDQYRIETYNTDQLTYQIFGGIYNTSVQFECYAGSTIEAQELGDLVERFLVELKKDPYNKAGFNLTSWSQPGQAEQDYINSHIFSCSIAVEGFVEWHNYESLETITSVVTNAIPNGTFSCGYLGSSVNSTGLISPIGTGVSAIPSTFSGIAAAPPLNNTTINAINAIYSGNNTSSGAYQKSFNRTGIGWFPSGSTIYWTNGHLADFAAATGTGLLPEENETYYVDYSFKSMQYCPIGVETYLTITQPIVQGGFANIQGVNPNQQQNQP